MHVDNGDLTIFSYYQHTNSTTKTDIKKFRLFRQMFICNFYHKKNPYIDNRVLNNRNLPDRTKQCIAHGWSKIKKEDTNIVR